MDWSPPSPTNCRALEWKYIEALRQATLERMEVHRAGTVEFLGYNSTEPTAERYRLIRRDITAGEVAGGILPPNIENPKGREIGDPIIYAPSDAVYAPSVGGIGNAINLAVRRMVALADPVFDGSFVDQRRNWTIPAAAGDYDATSGFPYLTKHAIETAIGEPIEFLACNAPVTYRWAWQMREILNLMVHYGCRIQLGTDSDPEAKANLVCTKRPAGGWNNRVFGTGANLTAALADLAANWSSASTSTFNAATSFSDNYGKAQTYAFNTTEVRAAAQECIGAGCASWDVLPLSADYAAEVDFYSRSRICGNNLVDSGDPRVFDNQGQDPTMSPVENQLLFLGTVAKAVGTRHAESPKIGDITIPPDFCPGTLTNYGIESGTTGLNSLALPSNLAITNIGIHRYDVVDGFRFVA